MYLIHFFEERRVTSVTVTADSLEEAKRKAKWILDNERYWNKVGCDCETAERVTEVATWTPLPEAPV